MNSYIFGGKILWTDYSVEILMFQSNIPEGSDTVSIVSKESSDNRSRSSTRSFRPRSNYGHALKKPNSILRHVLLKGMTSQVNSAAVSVIFRFSLFKF